MVLAASYVKPLSPGAQRVLKLARRRAARGVHLTDFDVPGQTADGGKPLKRLAARIDELKNVGHLFETRRRRDHTVDYVLVRDAETVVRALREASGRAPEPEPVPEPERLLVLPPAPPLSALLHDWGDE